MDGVEEEGLHQFIDCFLSMGLRININNYINKIFDLVKTVGPIFSST